ncbi:FAD-binding oxidoreductase [Bradyrhizobium niftali]|uniref:FAD-binding oxidoreductase n=1 Tax=Bradyrhizobium niftali TaxID=2560055 RepID=UPI00384F19AC
MPYKRAKLIRRQSELKHVLLRAFRDLLDDRGVVDEPGRIAAYTTDQRRLLTGSTFAVLKPTTTKQVADIVGLAAHHGIGIVPQGGNTSYCGGATPDASGRQIIVILERMDRIREASASIGTFCSMTASVTVPALVRWSRFVAISCAIVLAPGTFCNC